MGSLLTAAALGRKSDQYSVGEMLKDKLAQGLRILTDQRYRQFYSQRRIQSLSSRESMADNLARRLPAFKKTDALSAQSAELKSRGYLFLDNLIAHDKLVDTRTFFSENR